MYPRGPWQTCCHLDLEIEDEESRYTVPLCTDDKDNNDSLAEPLKTEAHSTETVKPLKTEASPSETVKPLKTEASPTETVKPLKTEASPTEKEDEESRHTSPFFTDDDDCSEPPSKNQKIDLTSLKRHLLSL